MKKTDMNKVISVAINYLYTDPLPVEGIPFLVHHPFLSSSFVPVADNSLQSFSKEPKVFAEFL